MKIKNLKDHFLSDTVFFGNEEDKVSELKAFHLVVNSDTMTYILKSRIEGIQDILNNPASTFITDYVFSPSDLKKLKKAFKNIIYSPTARLQMAKVSHLFDYEKQRLRTKEAHVEHDVQIGTGTKIYANASIYRGVKIGKNCIIHSGAVIGSDGFGYEKDTDGTWFKIAHLGGVVIGDNVEIGANACIDRGTLGDTIIEDGAKIDNLVHIAHNVHIKKNAMVIANSMIAGSVVVEEGAWIAPSSSVREGLKIGKNSLVGMGSVVVKNVEPNSTVMGVPAKEKQ